MIVDTSAMPEVELFATLATGNVTESLQEFFTDYLTSQVQKKNKKVCIAICKNIINLFIAYQTMGIQCETWIPQLPCHYL